MRLGRKISEGYAVDSEADRVAPPAPVAVQADPEPVEWAAADREVPARSGSRED